MSSKRTGDPVTVVYHSSSLRASDVQLLNGPNSLNDALLSFYYEYLERDKWKNNSDLLFFGPEATQCMKLLDDDDLTTMLNDMNADKRTFFFFVLSDADSAAGAGAASKSHWSLLVFSRPEKKFFHFDSKGTRHAAIASGFATHIRDVIQAPTAVVKPVRCLQQTNDFDGGIHVICMTDKIADYANRFDCVEGVESLQREVISIKRSDFKKLVRMHVFKTQKGN